MKSCYKVIDKQTKEEINVYNASLEGSLSWAKDCKRKMKNLTGKDYQIILSHTAEEGEKQKPDQEIKWCYTK